MGKELGSIAITYNKPFYHPGQQVLGQIYLQAQQEIDATELILKIRGKEKYKYPNDTEYKKCDQKDYFKLKYQVHKWDKGKIAAGQYQFPFSFNFPEDLPNSYEFYGDVKKGEPNAKIEYTVVCELDFEDKTFRKKEKINICRPKQVHQEEGKSRIFEFNVKQFFCCNKGTATVNPKFSSNNYRPGETADIITEVDNKDGKFYIEKIICDLKSEVTVGGNPPIKKFCKQAYYIGVNPNEDRTGEKKIKFTMEIPKDLQSATAGSLIQNKYELWCHCEQNTCCTNTAVIFSAKQKIAQG